MYISIVNCGWVLRKKYTGGIPTGRALLPSESENADFTKFVVDRGNTYGLTRGVEALSSLWKQQLAYTVIVSPHSFSILTAVSTRISQ